MAVRIRLRRMGRKKQPHYRIVVADSSSPRDGRFVENLGYYKPLTQPARLVIDLDRVDHWLTEGALPSGTVKNLIDRARKGGDAKVVVGAEDVEARKKEESEALHERRAAEKQAETQEAGAKKAEAEPVTVPEDETDKPAASSASDETPAETMAQDESEAVAQAEASEPNVPVEESIARSEASKGERASKKAAKRTEDDTPASEQVPGAKAGGEVKGKQEEQAPVIETPEAESEMAKAEQATPEAEAEAEESEEK